MLSERIQSRVMSLLRQRYLRLAPTNATRLPAPKPGQDYMLYAHVPFCEKLCPYCSFNRYPFTPQRAQPYFANLRREMRMLAQAGYDFSSLYIGGGTPTIMIDELTATIDLARQLFTIREVSTETNPNHLTPQIIDQLEGRVQRLSVGVQSFNDKLLQQMERYGKYGSGLATLERIQAIAGRFDVFNVDMIFNFPSQTEDILINDLAYVLESGASQTTFYPLMASPSVAHSLAATVGRVDYRREERYYRIISQALCGGPQPQFGFSSAWTFSRLTGNNTAAATQVTGLRGLGGIQPTMIDEYIVDYEEYPAIGCGGLSYLDGALYVNTFSVNDYNQMIEDGRMSVVGRTRYGQRDRMRYRFMMQLFGLKLDKQQWLRDFGCSVAAGLPAEYNFFKAVGAFAGQDERWLYLSDKGRYLMVALMREFFIGVNKVRDHARASLAPEERQLLFG